MKILFVTSNEGKVQEARQVLSQFGIDVENIDIDLTEVQAPHEDVVRLKALEARKHFSGDLVVEDAGFYIDAFNDFPGILTKPIVRGIGPQGFLKLVAGLDRSAHFLSIVAYLQEGAAEPLLFKGKSIGKLSETMTESNPKLPCDSIFIPEGETRTFGQMTPAEKSLYSHRAKAFQELAYYLKTKP